MNEKFYSIGRGSLNINGKFYYGLDYQITDFMINLEQENKQLKEQLQQKEDILEKAKEYIKKHLNAKSYGNHKYELFSREYLEDLLKILDNKGDE